MLLYSKLSEKNKCNSIYNLDYWQDVKKHKKKFFAYSTSKKLLFAVKENN